MAAGADGAGRRRDARRFRRSPRLDGRPGPGRKPVARTRRRRRSDRAGGRRPAPTAAPAEQGRTAAKRLLDRVRRHPEGAHRSARRLPCLARRRQRKDARPARRRSAGRGDGRRLDHQHGDRRRRHACDPNRAAVRKIRDDRPGDGGDGDRRRRDHPRRRRAPGHPVTAAGGPHGPRGHAAAGPHPGRGRSCLRDRPGRLRPGQRDAPRPAAGWSRTERAGPEAASADGGRRFLQRGAAADRRRRPQRRTAGAAGGQPGAADVRCGSARPAAAETGRGLGGDQSRQRPLRRTGLPALGDAATAAQRSRGAEADPRERQPGRALGDPRAGAAGAAERSAGRRRTAAAGNARSLRQSLRGGAAGSAPGDRPGRGGDRGPLGRRLHRGRDQKGRSEAAPAP